MIDFGYVLTAMVTPFKKDGSVDYANAEKLASYLLENGSDSLVLHATTGESPTLTHEEEFELEKIMKKAVGKKTKLVAGTGSNSTAEAIEATEKAEKIGMDGVLLVVPYYNKPSQEGMYQHFKAIAERTGLPVIIYNIQGRTGVNMTADTLARLAKIKNIVAIKEASGIMEQISEMRAKTPKDFVIYSGDDDRTLEIMKRGGKGVISVVSHIVGKEIRKMCELFHAGKIAEAEAINNRLAPLFKVLFITTNPTPVKAALAMVGRPVGGLRLPLIEANESEKEQIKKVLQDLKLI